MINIVISSKKNKIKTNQRTSPKPSTQHARKKNVINEVTVWQKSHSSDLSSKFLKRYTEYLKFGYLGTTEKQTLKKFRIKILMPTTVVFSFRSFSLHHQYRANCSTCLKFYRSAFEQKRNGLMRSWLSHWLNINTKKREKCVNCQFFQETQIKLTV